MKHIPIFILSGLLTVSTVPVVWADGVQPPLMGTGLHTPVEYTVTVNGKKLDLGEKAVYLSGDQIMVPLRAVAEGLDFAVTWNGEAQSVQLDDQTVKTTIYLGKDSYYKQSAQAIGLTAAVPLGAAPELKNDTTYVPVKLFAWLYSNANAVQISGTEITVSKISAPVELPSPIKSYDTVEQARAALGFDAVVPAELPEGYIQADITTISNQTLQIFYTNGEAKISYRTAKGTEDISGDYTQYENTKTVTAGETVLTVKSNGDLAFTAIWTKDDYTYSIHADHGIDLEHLIKMVESIS